MSEPDSWRVLTIELSEELPELRSEPGYQGLYCIFFWCGTALGHRRLSNEELPLTAPHLANVAARAIASAVGDRLLNQGFRSALPGLVEPPVCNPEKVLSDLLELTHPLARLRQRLAEPRAFAATVSVAVCTRDRPEQLTRCLQSLLCSSERPLEIVVIDNAPRSDATRQVVARFPQVRYYREPCPGLSRARNTAMAITTGDVIAFADDDVTVDTDWVAKLSRSFEDPKVMLVTGLVLPAELETQAQAIFERDFQYFHQGYRARYFDTDYFAKLRGKGVPVWSIGAGANMAIRRSAFQRGYRFSTRLGPGVFGGCGEDSEFWYHVMADGWSCFYEPAAAVYHYHRRDLRSLRRLVRDYMQGHVAALLLQAWRYRHAGNLRRLLLRLPVEYALLMLRLVVSGFSLDNRILLSGMRGCVAGLRFPFWRQDV
jgi:GT2 family glycosyltransferase